MSGEPVLASHDPNYKWRVLGAIGVVFITSFAVTTTAIFSAALSAGYIVGLFGMQFAIVLIVTVLVLRYPSPSANQKGFTMDNPLVAVPFLIVAGLLTSLFIKWLAIK